MADEKMPHPGHENHLCYLQGKGLIKDNPDKFKGMVRNGSYMCKGCGRVAAQAGSLCAPEKL